MYTRHLIALIPLALASLATAQWTGQPCGFRLAPCPEDATCVPDDANVSADVNLDNCAGHCEFINAYEDCGGFRLEPKDCAEGASCVDDPRTPWSCGMACDAPGICLPDNQPVCNGFAGFQCPEGLYCYDNPSDGCDVNNGGADCLGICL